MADRPLPQQRLCDDLAALLFLPSMLPNKATTGGGRTKNHKAQPRGEAVEAVAEEDDDDDEEQEPEAALATAWLRAFWATMSQQWTTGIDVLRMDKFLLLVRRVHGASLKWVVETRRRVRNEDQESGQGRADRLEGRMRRVWADWPLDVGDKAGDTARVPVGLRLHAVDIWLDECQRADMLRQVGDDDDEEGGEGEEGEGKSDGQAREVRWEPWMAVTVAWMQRRVDQMSTKAASKAVRARAKESLDDERLRGGLYPNDNVMADAGEEGEGEDTWDGFDD